MTAIVIFFAAAVAIYVACSYFVNGIEWTGHKWGVSETATGTILAAFGTALPESAVTFMAVVFGQGEQKEIGVGAAMGGPLVLATISYATVGVVLWRNSRKLNRTDTQIHTDQKRLSRDQLWFLSIFICKLALGLVAFSIKPWLGIVFLAAYGIYAWTEMTGQGALESDDALEPLYLCPKSANPTLFMVLLQTLGALTVIGVASHIFVSQVEAIGHTLGLTAQLVALLLSPVATELPETMNAIIWVRQGKERLALANISGAMMIQATVPSALGIIFTPWILSPPLLIAGACTTFAIVFLYAMFRRGKVNACTLMAAGLFYGIFASILLVNN